MTDTVQEGMRGGVFVSDKNEPCYGTFGKPSDEIENGEKKITKLDQMIEEFNKNNPGRDTKKRYGGTY